MQQNKDKVIRQYFRQQRYRPRNKDAYLIETLEFHLIDCHCS